MSEALVQEAPRKTGVALLLQFRQLVALLVVRELKVRYKRSVLGLFWTMLNPLLLMIVYTIVFTTVMPSGQRNFSLFLLCALLPWLFFSTAVMQGLASVLANQELIRKVRLPQAVFPLSVVGSNLVNFGLSFVPLVALMLLLRQPFTRALLFLPVSILLLTLFTSGATMLFASLTVFFRDVRHLTEVLLQVLMYLSPVLYDLQGFGDRPFWWFKYFRLFLKLNPMTYLIALVREPVYYGRLPGLHTIAAAVVSSVFSLVFGYAIFARLESRHIHYF
jgi:lipopolysaccharide transport system permease protein